MVERMPKYLIKAIFIPDNTKVIADRLVETDWLLVDPDKVNEITIFDKKYIRPLQCKDCAYYIPIVRQSEKRYRAVQGL